MLIASIQQFDGCDAIHQEIPAAFEVSCRITRPDVPYQREPVRWVVAPDTLTKCFGINRCYFQTLRIFFILTTMCSRWNHLQRSSFPCVIHSPAPASLPSLSLNLPPFDELVTLRDRCPRPDFNCPAGAEPNWYGPPPLALRGT